MDNHTGLQFLMLNLVNLGSRDFFHRHSEYMEDLVRFDSGQALTAIIHFSFRITFQIVVTLCIEKDAAYTSLSKLCP